MGYLFKSGMIVQLENGDYYFVLARVICNGQEYADVVKYPKNKEDYFHEETLERKVVSVKKHGEKIYIKSVDDKEIQEKVRKVGNSKLKPVRKVKK